MSSQPRTLTLEAQRDDLSEVSNLRRRVNKLFTGPAILDDVAEQQLKAQISESSDNERTFFTHLLGEYRRFKNAPGHRLGNQIFQSWTFEEDVADGGIKGNGLYS